MDREISKELIAEYREEFEKKISGAESRDKALKKIVDMLEYAEDVLTYFDEDCEEDDIAYENKEYKKNMLIIEAYYNIDLITKDEMALAMRGLTGSIKCFAEMVRKENSTKEKKYE